MILMRALLCAGLLLVAAHGFTTIPFGRTRIGHFLLLSVAESDDSEAVSETDGSLEMEFDDAFEILEASGELEMLLQEDSLVRETGAAIASDSEEELGEIEGEEADIVAQFLAMVKETPRGSMDNDEIGLLRSVMQGIVAENCASNSTETARQVEKLLFRMLDEYDDAKRSKNTQRMELVQPTPEDFALSSQAWLESDSKDGKNRAVSVFFEQEQFFAGNNICKPTLENVHTVLDTLAESRSRDGDRKAWSIVQKLDEYELTPTAQMYTALIKTLARSRQRGSAQRAEEALNDAVKKFPPVLDSKGDNIGMTVESFNVVLTAWAKSEQDDGPDRAGELLIRMEEVDNQQGILKPTASSFTSLIDAYAQMKSWETACQAERTLNALLGYYLEDQDPTLEPNIATWGIVLSAWYRLSKKGSSDAASKAGHLLKRMETLHEDAKLSYGPDAIAYVTVMNAWAMCKDTEMEGAKHAQALLDEMNERYLDGDDSFKPSPKSVRALVDAWIKSTDPKSLEKAEDLMERYEDMEYLSDPGDKSVLKDIYKSLLFGWCKNANPERAHEFLSDMVDQELEPDSFCFDKVIEAYTNDEGHRLDKIKEVFALMEQASDAGGVKPNERVYTSYIRALTNAKIPNLVEEASGVLERMNREFEEGNKGIRPTVFTYNAVLKACATCISEDQATNMVTFKVALSVFNELRAIKEQPDHVTFGNMLRCAALLPQGPQREAMISTTFQLCCRSGFLNSFVVRDLQFAAEEELWRDLCSCPVGEVDLDQLPQAWIKKFEKKEKRPMQRGRKRF